jgi:N-acylmannosamine kinase
MNKTIAFDIGATNSRIALFEDGRPVWKDQAATPGREGPEAIVAMMENLFRPLEQHTTASVGVAIAATVIEGQVTAHNVDVLPGWQGFPLERVLSERLRRPVRTANDARAAAWGEFMHGAGRGCDEFLFVTVSTGVGAGLVLNRQLHLAHNGFDAELGETRATLGGTLEEHASGTALGKLAAQHGYTDGKSLCDAADQGDPQAEGLYRRGIRELALKLADLAVMLGIQRTAIGGSVGLRNGYVERLREEIMQFPPMYRVELTRAELGHDAGLYGAASLMHG